MNQPQSQSRLNVAVIGIGAMGLNHVRVYSEMDSVSLVAIADPEEDALYGLASRYHTHPYADYHEMLAKESLDIVSVAVPTHLHREVAEEVIRQGVHLLIEKPLALTVAEGEQIIRMAKQKGVRLGVGHVERFNPVVAAMKQRLEDGVLGRVLQITIRRIGPYPERVRDVGVFLDLATHDIDIMLYLTGADVQRISAESAQVFHTRHEDIAVGLLRFTNGMIGVLIENWLSPTKVRDAVINGERGMLVADFLTQDLYFYENNYTPSNWGGLQVFRGMVEGNMVRYRLNRDEPLRLELEAFVRTVNGKESFMVSGEDGLRAIRLAEQLANCAIHSRQVTAGEDESA